jgi:acyl-CoA thioesterase I
MRRLSFRTRPAVIPIVALLLAALFSMSYVTGRLIPAADEPLEEASVPGPSGSRIPPLGTINMLVLGSSLSAGADWPEVLRDGLQDASRDCTADGVELRVIAKGGADSSWGLVQLTGGLDFRPDLVLIEFMINDADIRKRLSRSESLRNHTEIIETLRDAHPDTAIFLLRLNRAYGPRALLRPALAGYERLLPEIARRSSVGLIDLRPEWRDRWKSEGYRSLPDGLHPTVAAARDVNVTKLLSTVGGLLQARCR